MTESSQIVQDEPLTLRGHLDPDKHWVGESLGVPTQTEIAATVGNISGPGDSPFVARADHTHKIDIGVLPYFIGNIGNAATTSGTTPLVVCTIAFTERPKVGGILYNALVRIEKSVNTDVFLVEISDTDGGIIAQVQTRQGTQFEYLNLTGFRGATLAARTITLVITRIVGTGTASTIASTSNNNLSALFIPTA